eukprot:6792325-Prymnesium_polylepis.2
MRQDRQADLEAEEDRQLRKAIAASLAENGGAEATEEGVVNQAAAGRVATLEEPPKPQAARRARPALALAAVEAFHQTHSAADFAYVHRLDDRAVACLMGLGPAAQMRVMQRKIASQKSDVSAFVLRLCKEAADVVEAAELVDAFLAEVRAPTRAAA